MAHYAGPVIEEHDVLIQRCSECGMLLEHEYRPDVTTNFPKFKPGTYVGHTGNDSLIELDPLTCGSVRMCK